MNNNKSNSSNNMTLVRDVWTHLCYRFQDYTLASVFANGTKITDKQTSSSSSKTEPSNIATSDTIALMSVGGDGFIGDLSNVFVYSKALSDNEIQDSFQNHEPLNGVLVGWWTFVL